MLTMNKGDLRCPLGIKTKFFKEKRWDVIGHGINLLYQNYGINPDYNEEDAKMLQNSLLGFPQKYGLTVEASDNKAIKVVVDWTPILKYERNGYIYLDIVDDKLVFVDP